MNILKQTDFRVATQMISESDTLWAWAASMVHEQKSEEWAKTLINELVQSMDQNFDMIYDMFGSYVCGTITKYSLLINLS